MFICGNCGKELKIDGKVSRGDICPYCHSYLHSCINCEFYSPGYHNDCREPQADPVSDKKKGNFCEYFRFKKAEGLSSKTKNKATDAREAFKRLFGE